MIRLKKVEALREGYCTVLQAMGLASRVLRWFIQVCLQNHDGSSRTYVVKPTQSRGKLKSTQTDLCGFVIIFIRSDLRFTEYNESAH